jgi:hypothetical protein
MWDQPQDDTAEFLMLVNCNKDLAPACYFASPPATRAGAPSFE